MGQRITTMTSGQSAFPVVKSMFKFAQHGQAGAWVSELLPHIAGIVDDLCIIKTVNTEAINHDPAITLYPDRLPTARPSVHGRMAQLRPGQREPGSARLHRDALERQGERSTALHPAVGSGSCRPSIRASSSAAAVDPVLFLSNPPGVSSAPAAGGCSTAWRS
jgi:hypothetical protein